MSNMFYNSIMVKQTNTKKLWRCVSSFTNKDTCTNSIVATNEDNRLTTFGNSWVSLFGEEKRYLPNTRYFLCEDCNNLNDNRLNEIEIEFLSSLI